MAFELAIKTLEVRREWKEVFKILRVSDFQPGILYPAKLSFRVNIFSDIPDLKKNLTSMNPFPRTN